MMINKKNVKRIAQFQRQSIGFYKKQLPHSSHSLQKDCKSLKPITTAIKIRFWCEICTWQICKSNITKRKCKYSLNDQIIIYHCLLFNEFQLNFNIKLHTCSTATTKKSIKWKWEGDFMLMIRGKHVLCKFTHVVDIFDVARTIVWS